MDMSFAIQALSAKYLVEHGREMTEMLIDVRWKSMRMFRESCVYGQGNRYADCGQEAYLNKSLVYGDDKILNRLTHILQKHISSKACPGYKKPDRSFIQACVRRFFKSPQGKNSPKYAGGPQDCPFPVANIPTYTPVKLRPITSQARNLVEADANKWDHDLLSNQNDNGCASLQCQSYLTSGSRDTGSNLAEIVRSFLNADEALSIHQTFWKAYGRRGWLPV